MRNLTNVFIESAPSRFRLPFGISNNVILKSVSNEIRRDKNGVKINKNCWMTFASLDMENDRKVKAESTFSYFNLEKPKFAIDNFRHQFVQLVEIATAVVPSDKRVEAMAPLQEVLNSSEDIFKQIKGKKDGEPSVKLVKDLVKVQNAMADAFVEAMQPYLGDNSELVRLMVVTGTNGQFFELPREDKGFISKMKGGRQLTIDGKYIRWYEERDEKKKADKDDIGDEEAIVSEDELVLEDEQDLDGL